MRRRLGFAVAAVFGLPAALLLLITTAGWWVSAPGYSGPLSAHFDGERFDNTEPTPLPDGAMALRMLREGRSAPWEQRAIVPQPLPPERVDGDAMRVTFVNHSTTLIQVAGLNLLTDPIWSERCSAVQWAGPRRHHPVPFELDELPPIDVVLVSHNHYDHLDLPTLVALAERDNPKVYAGLGNAALLQPLGIDAVDMDWGDRREHGAVSIVGSETRHFTSRGLFDRMKTLWLGFVIESEAGSIYFGGDTGYGPHFAETGARHGPFRLALLPIGAYAPRWFMGPIHQDPVEAVQAHRDLRAQTSIGIHFGTFQLTREGQDAPVVELLAAREAAGLSPEAFRTLAPGEGLDVP